MCCSEHVGPDPHKERGKTFRTSAGMATLGEELVEIRGLLDDHFVHWAAEAGAARMLFPPLLRVHDLDGFDHFRNFPHLPVLASRIAPSRVADYTRIGGLHFVPSTDLSAAEYALPSAACYNVYLHLSDTVLAEPRYVTTIATCFRNEREYVGMRRLWAFSMREIVCVGPREAVIAHLARFKEKILDFTRRLGLTMKIEVGADPFFQPENTVEKADSVRALTQKLFPTKEEFVFGESLAIASVNFHRNFFGERSRIRTADGQFAFTGCVAFGIERWMHALLEVFGDDTHAIVSAIRGCR